MKAPKHWFFNIAFGATDKTGGMLTTIIRLDVPYVNAIALDNARQQNGIGPSAPLMSVSHLGCMTEAEWTGAQQDANQGRSVGRWQISSLVVLVISFLIWIEMIRFTHF